MGQQQLLLVILVTIIVGIATVVAINTFGQAADSAAQDAVRQDLATIAASAQGYFMKPRMLGGGGRAFDEPGDGISFNDIAFGGSLATDADNNDAEIPTEAINENGAYQIGTVGPNSFVVTAWVGATAVDDGDASVIRARICADNMVLGAVDAAAPAEGDCTNP